MKQLSWHTNWQSTMLVDQIILPNHFSINIEFEAGDGNELEQLVAFDRIKYYINTVLEGSLFANIDNPLVNKLEKSFNVYVITLPSEPMDHIIASVVFSKIISIVEGRLDIHSVTFSSRLGEEVSNYIDTESLASMGYMINNKVKATTGTLAWWHRPDAGSSDIITVGKDKVSVVIDKQEWVDFDLGWESVKIPNGKDAASVVKLPVKSWKPKIIPGGKEEDA
jgi:hypothetical protein